jgi:Cdc6-like AAA superfamily ATPase
MAERPAIGRVESNLVGRRWELSAIESLLDRAVDGHGAVVTLMGSPGIGKSRLVREMAAIAARREVEVFSAYCESHATDIPFHVVARLLRAAFGVRDLEGGPRQWNDGRPPTEFGKTRNIFRTTSASATIRPRALWGR